MTPQPSYRVLLARKLNCSDIEIQWTDSAYSYPASLEARIETFWTRRTSPHLYNGNLVRLDTLKNTLKGPITLHGRPVEYKRVLYTEYFSQDIIDTAGRTGLARALGVSVVLVTQDNRFVFIHRSHSVGEYPNHYDVVGGHIAAPAVHPQDLFAAMRKEIGEELNLSERDFQLELLGLAEVSRTDKPELIFSASVAMTETDVRRVASAAVDADEYQRLFSKSGRQPQPGSHERNLWAPSALAALDIYQRVRSDV